MKTGELANGVGLWLLDCVQDARALGAVVFALIALTFLVRYTRDRTVPGRDELLPFVSIAGSIISVVVVVAVFLLTKPPAVDRASPTLLVVAGSLTTIFLGNSVVRQIRTVMLPPGPKNAPTPPKPPEA
ncbi:hypothetical protein [Anaeromyxobacter oryzae]|uniref:hypothetical protein n=1 Tax=Anaeromyxobacter oryzae TaxID=2918170 RepID=UPI0020BE9770|nr:hypothetical protein [Anaeromyxobacter oryzae]